MVLRIVYKRSLLPISIRTFVLNTIAFAGILSILAIGLRILAPLHAFSSSSTLSPAPTLVADRSFVVLSVDDFGRWTDSVPLFPNPEFMSNHSDLIIQNNFWYRRATVETSHDLQQLAQALLNLNHNVSYEQRALLTPHWIVGGPDFGAMRAAGCGANRSSPPTQQHQLSQRTPTTSLSPILLDLHLMTDNQDHLQPSLKDYDSCVYKEQLLSDAGPTGLDQAPYWRGDLREHYKSLWKQGLWHPEYHGRSHFSVAKWLKLLKTDPKTQACFENNLVCATDTMQLRSEFNGFSDKNALKTWLEEGINAFSSFWGYRPALISSPHNTWSSWLTDVAVDLGFLGAELAEDQANYVQHDNALSLHDRYRFDVFFPGFECDKAIEEVLELLRVPLEKSWMDRWYDFLSMIDLFRVHHRPYHHGSGGDHQRFISLMWHAQNAMSSTYSTDEHTHHMQCLEKAVRTIRQERPRAVFVTGSELHQIRSQGWSEEVWSDRVILRNYGTHVVEVNVPDLRDLYPESASWQGRPLQATVVSLHGKTSSNYADGIESEMTEAFRTASVAVGDILELLPDSVVHLTVE